MPTMADVRLPHSSSLFFSVIACSAKQLHKVNESDLYLTNVSCHFAKAVSINLEKPMHEKTLMIRAYIKMYPTRVIQMAKRHCSVLQTRFEHVYVTNSEIDGPTKTTLCIDIDYVRSLRIVVHTFFDSAK